MRHFCRQTRQSPAEMKNIAGSLRQNRLQDVSSDGTTTLFSLTSIKVEFV